jgi:hypothetical protein
MRLETLGDKTALFVGWRSGSPMALRIPCANKAETAEFRRRKRGLEAA